MKIGSETGSIINHIRSLATRGQPEPAVGMGVTFLSWSDRNPGTIQRVFSIGRDTAIECSYDDYKRIDNNGMSECQSYEYKTVDSNLRTTWRFRNNKWECVRFKPETKRWNKYDAGGLRIGQREKYHDFSF